MPVPGLELLGLVEPSQASVVPLTKVPSGQYLLARIGEPVQLDMMLLRQFKDLGLMPGSVVRVEAQGDWFIAPVGLDEGLSLDIAIAAHIFVNTAEA
jgi:DtxR family Mn-dependent transcriptional regulator